MANVKNNAASRLTRQRLLLAAGEIFAERGYHAATIADITGRAGASLASVNYHFTDKAELYAAVIGHVADRAAGLIPEPIEGTSEQQLRQFVRHFLANVCGVDRPSWEALLMTRELADPTPAFASFVDRAIRPMHERVEQIIRPLLPPRTSRVTRGLLVATVFAQCMYFIKHGRVIEQLYPPFSIDTDREKLASLIVSVVLGGLGAGKTSRIT